VIRMMSWVCLAGRRGANPVSRGFGQRRSLFTGTPKKFDKILIANRGEIACRVMKTAKAMGIKTVAVHSEIDMYAKHVLMADEAVNIGPAPSSQSYLLMDKIVDACLATGAQAVHPGYGFLSENRDFVAKLDQNNITFIGPNTDAIWMMGDKIESKKIAKDAGVNIIPGFLGEIKTVEEALEIVKELGYPVILKASAGGGGKGMRVAWNEQEVREGFEHSKKEAKASFGDDRLLIERFVNHPRHIEVQVLCDKHGNCLYLNERECSIQRRNQKVIEEAPSPFLTPELRKAMGEQAVALCRRVGYDSAGTCEMMVDGDRNFYFLEMNTRLQVEHPITEMITGVDIVEQMIRVAQGEKLSLTQSDIGVHGWAMEARVYAEDPVRGFLPSIGRLSTYVEPPAGKDAADNEVRVDSGILEGSQITTFYDPLISKVITHGATRDAAITTMCDALDNYTIRGLNHNVAFLRDVMTNKKFLSGSFTTAFIPEEYSKGFRGHVLTADEKSNLIGLSAALHELRQIRNQSISKPTEDEFNDPVHRYVVQDHEGESHNVVVEVSASAKTFTVGIESKTDESEETFLQVSLEDYYIDNDMIYAIINSVEITAQLIKITDLGFHIQYLGTIYPVQVLSVTEAQYYVHMKENEASEDANILRSPMAGTLISLNVKVGDKVFPSQELCTVEAMKMHNALKATNPGIVKAIKHKVGDGVLLDDVLIEFDEVPKEDPNKK